MRQILNDWFQAEDLLFLGISSLDCESEFKAFAKWRAEKRHAGLSYLEQNDQLRRNPSTLFPGANTALIFAMRTHIKPQKSPAVARYALFRDYHRSMKSKGERILAKLREQHWDPSLEGRVCVDSVPILERALANQTEFGFIGKNTLYIHPRWGSYLLLGEVIINVAMERDLKKQLDPQKRSDLGGCGSCRRCQVNCPTGALDVDYQIDARRCLSYWTIENRGTIPLQYWDYLATYYFGCDICQDVCPYNRPARRNPLVTTAEGVTIEELDLIEIATMSQGDYERWFGGTPMTRAKKSGLQRNALIAMVVTSHPQVEKALFDLSATDNPMLRETIKQAWDWKSGVRVGK